MQEIQSLIGPAAAPAQSTLRHGIVGSLLDDAGLGTVV